MTPVEARRLVIVCLVVAGLSSAVNDAAKRQSVPRLRIAVGAAIAAAVLSAASDVAPQVAAMLAVSLAVTALLTGGTATAALVTRLTAPKE